jgi:hypothetical protein
MRLPAEIMGEWAPDEWTGREWRVAHDMVAAALDEGRWRGWEEAAQSLDELGKHSAARWVREHRPQGPRA